MTDSVRYLGSRAGAYNEGEWVILGAPLDETTTFGKGTKDGPASIRNASDCLEEYCPVADRSLDEVGVVDIGDIPVNVVPFPKNLDFIKNAVAKVLSKGGRPLMLGGEHTVTLPAFEAVLARNSDLVLVQFDAHADLRIDYDGNTFSHACVVRRIEELVGPGRIHQFGIRSGTRDEWRWMRDNDTVLPCNADGIERLRAEVGDRPVYLTVDLDVLDPGAFPGTGTPEPGGLSFLQLDDLIRRLAVLDVVAADVVELAPNLDLSGVSSVTAGKVVRTMLLSL